MEEALRHIKHVRDYISGYCIVTIHSAPQARKPRCSPEEYILERLDEAIKLMSSETQQMKGE